MVMDRHNAVPGAMLHDTGLLLIRLMVGVVFIFHGAQKMFGVWDGPGLEGFATTLGDKLGFPMPGLNAFLAASAELFGGMVLVLGTGTRVAAIPMAFTMAVACYVHRGAFSIQANGMEYALTLGVILVALGLMGPGRFTIPRLLAGVEATSAPSQEKA